MDSGPTGDQAERFARALDAGAAGPEFETELAIVAALRGLDIGPDEAARARMLAKATPAISSRRGRFLVAAAAAVVLVFALAGMSLLLSRDALPGDTLYGVKRTAEAASLGLTFGDESKALKHLEFANARVGELETLAQRHPDPADAPVGGYLTALTDFDADATQAARQLIALATRGDVRQLDSLRAWAGQQKSRLIAVHPQLPPQVQSRTETSRQLLDKIAGRAEVLLGRADCYQITTGSSDEVGALPATDACHRDTSNSVAPGAPSAPVQPVPPRIQASYPAPPPVPAQPTPPPAVTSAPPVPLVPAPAPTPSIPTPAVPTAPSQPRLPVPILEVPPLLPGLPAIRVG
ncbi:DUF5667 domain-containing protein [Kibdelosporangium persicum]|uniref:Vegetative cell wall protein gp1 n=1 Tax=Kibdelosporangium persicum TaxID=2698649 RepID=A0ABX2FCK0_9PSEU|nr:DUF5667 domain-containing protein [Kibdelosporangium persicum]NRN68611.1 Vegetative cell wall protein gp1 [Kibdelosporangium persicum]